jgi:hypothetical protein
MTNTELLSVVENLLGCGYDRRIGNNEIHGYEPEALVFCHPECRIMPHVVIRGDRRIEGWDRRTNRQVEIPPSDIIAG